VAVSGDKKCCVTGEKVIKFLGKKSLKGIEIIVRKP
jgi:hypothetical protein